VGIGGEGFLWRGGHDGFWPVVLHEASHLENHWGQNHGRESRPVKIGGAYRRAKPVTLAGSSVNRVLRGAGIQYQWGQDYSLKEFANLFRA
jgi:hypothetical protein